MKRVGDQQRGRVIYYYGCHVKIKGPRGATDRVASSSVATNADARGACERTRAWQHGPAHPSRWAGGREEVQRLSADRAGRAVVGCKRPSTTDSTRVNSKRSVAWSTRYIEWRPRQILDLPRAAFPAGGVWPPSGRDARPVGQTWALDRR
jgi:hypothetical protein